LKESISKSHIYGIIFIIIGTIQITLFNENPSTIPISALNFEVLIVFSLIIIIIEIIVFILSKYYKLSVIGFISGIMAGTFMALQTVSKRITAIPNSLISTIFVLITFIMAILTLFMTQYAFTKTNANIVVPCSTSSSIILAILIGVISLNEYLVINQIIGIIILVGGIIVLTGFQTSSIME
jgi:drug/metabolite transporter (DMT)-like permease